MQRAITLITLLAAGLPALAANEYAIVIAKDTLARPEWRAVAEALVAKHPGAVQVEWDKEVTEARAELARLHPRQVAFVARMEEAGVDFVKSVHRLTRKLDADPYTDCQWGIVTGFDAANALQIAQEAAPLVIRHTVAATDVAHECCDSAAWFSELKAGLRGHKEADGKVTDETGPADSAADIAKALEDPRTGLFITSGHASTRDWQPGYAYRNGHWRSKAGKLSAVDLGGVACDIHSPQAKVYLPIGNCLMGQIDGPDAMALAFMNRVGVRQMAGYTLPTWYGYAGWGLLDYFVEQPGRFTLTEAFFANQNALIHRLETYFPEAVREEAASPTGRISASAPVGAAAKAAGLTAQDAGGLLFDRDVVAFYGDPAWQARMAPGPLRWEQRWQQDAEGGSLEIIPKAEQNSFAPVNTNGSQRGGRPIMVFFHDRIDPASVKITAGAEFKPLITDDFLLLPLPDASAPAKPFKVSFSARKAD